MYTHIHSIYNDIKYIIYKNIIIWSYFQPFLGAFLCDIVLPVPRIISDNPNSNPRLG